MLRAASILLRVAAGAAAAGAPSAIAATDDAPATDILSRLAAFEERWEETPAVRGAATVKVYGEEESNFTLAWGRLRPDRTRLEVSAPLYGTAVVLTARGEEMLAYYPHENAAVVMTAEEWNPSAVLGTAFDYNLHELVDGLLGQPPLYLVDGTAAALEVEATPGDSGGEKIVWRRAETSSRVQELTLSAAFAGGERRPLHLRLFEADAPVVDVTYAEWTPAVGEGPAAPRAVTLKTEDRVAEIRITKLEFDVAFPEGAFSTTPPAGAAVYEPAPAAERYDEID
ncbi:MAG: hypothetical protein JSU81_11300 [Candidatus Coatesbacteria bacterium]|nr:MAG: hypothetical protein JSU81_11300 [Candidatus Coatesbacteria bacterium]